MPKNKKRLVLLDAHAILHRAYHALPDFASDKGEPTGALYGLSAMLMKIIGELKPDYIAACYDLPGPTFRHEAYKDYKAKRPKAEDDLVMQMKRSRDIFTAFHIPMYDHPGFEADDVLGTIVEKLKKDNGVEIIIASGDMDTLQLIDDKKVQVYTLRKGISDTILYDEEKVKERFGFGPGLLPDYKGLRGDPSDNIIGVPGIGEKTASILITEFGTIEKIYSTLKKDEEALKKTGLSPRIIGILKEHEEEAQFSKELATIRRDAPVNFVLSSETWRESLDLKGMERLFHELGFRSLMNRAKTVFSKEVGTSDGAKEKEDVTPAPEVVDPHEFKEAAVALWLQRSDLTNPTLEDMLEFSRKATFPQAREHIFERLIKEGLTKIYEDIERPLIPISERMTARGIAIDVPYLKALSKEYHKELAAVEKRIYETAGEEFNINSPRQLAHILFEKMALSVKNHKKTGTGLKSTRESELEKLRDAHPIIGEILAHRELQKLLSTYIDNLPALADKEGRIHATFLQTGTTTGRMSSQNPNLQNIPIRSESGKKIRSAFVASKGFSLVAFDYSQIDLKVAAFLSGDEKLVHIFRDGIDVHTAVAAEVFGVPPEMVNKEMRRQAKVINFGILYGMGVNALRQNLGSTRPEAQRFFNEYFKQFSGLAKYLEEVKKEAAKKGYTETFFGRRRYFEGINSPIQYIKAQAERMAINAPIQGTASDIIKLAMVSIDAYLEKGSLRDAVYLLLQVHDELVYEIRQDMVAAVAPVIKKHMESVLPSEKTKGIVLSVAAHVGKRWGNMEPLSL